MSAFGDCKSLVRVAIPDHVTRIQRDAFCDCCSLRFIQLPRNLEYIGQYDFYNCTSVEAIYLPPTVNRIDEYAFCSCKSLRFLFVPEGIDLLGDGVVQICERLLTTVKYKRDANDTHGNDDEVNQWLMQRHADHHLHKICSSTAITPQMITNGIQEHGIERATEVDYQQMTALHIIAANPHVTGDCIRAYLQLAPGAADQQDSEGMTPFQHLCRNDVTFIEDRSFSSLRHGGMVACLPRPKRVRSESVDDYGVTEYI